MREIRVDEMIAEAAAEAAKPQPKEQVKIHGAENIKRHLQRKKRDLVKDAHTSIAPASRHTGQPHTQSREAMRRQRQMERAK